MQSVVLYMLLHVSKGKNNNTLLIRQGFIEIKHMRVHLCIKEGRLAPCLIYILSLILSSLHWRYRLAYP